LENTGNTPIGRFDADKGLIILKWIFKSGFQKSMKTSGVQLIDDVVF
jgi:hypothetical protein